MPHDNEKEAMKSWPLAKLKKEYRAIRAFLSSPNAAIGRWDFRYLDNLWEELNRRRKTNA